MEANGIFSLMLHSHIPYCRKSGTWPAGEEWLFEAMHETYIPLLSVFRRFQQQNYKPKIMIGIVPILAEQLADKYMNERFVQYMEDKIDRTERDILRFRNHEKMLEVALFWKENYMTVLDAYKNDFYQNILGSFKWLQEEGVVEVLTSAASHGFLPLLEYDSGIYSQIHLGVQTYEKYFGRKPKGIWLPECAYRYKEKSKHGDFERRSIDEWLADEKIKYFFTEDIGITGAEFIDNKYHESNPTTYRGYKLESGVCVFGRNSATGKQVWSSEIGYPGNSSYREFHQKDLESGLNYWKITGKPEKDIYNPSAALSVVYQQADHFINLLQEKIKKHKTIIAEAPPIIVSPYDCELYGHWWLEGVNWIDSLYDKLQDQTEVLPMALSEYITKYGDTFSTIRMKSSTWGENGDFTVWNNPEHAWLWPYINSSIKNFEEVLDQIKSTGRICNPRDTRILKQIARELTLMEGSDWPFLLYTKQAKEYANKRFHNHHQRFNKLIWAAKNFNEVNRISENELLQMEDIDNPWSNIDYSIFNNH